MTDITALILPEHEMFRRTIRQARRTAGAGADQPRGTGPGMAPARREAPRARYIEKDLSQRSSAGRTIPRARRSTRSVITTTFATACATLTRPGSALTSGGRRSGAPGWPTTITWARKSEKDFRTSVARPYRSSRGARTAIQRVHGCPSHHRGIADRRPRPAALRRGSQGAPPSKPVDVLSTSAA